MDDLGTLMREAVEHVDPMPRQRELWDGVNVATKRRTRHRAIGGLLAAAVLVTGGAVAAHHSSDSEPQPVGPPRAVDRGQSRYVYGIYYVGQTPSGPRLYREFRAGLQSEKDLTDALRLLEVQPTDPDYTTYWHEGQLLGATVDNGVIDVDVDPSVSAPLQGGPGGDLVVQQLVYTVQGVVGDRLPVQFVHDGNPIAEVFGVAAGKPIADSAELDVLALVSISDPADRRVVEDYFSAQGKASSFEGNVPWQLKAPDGTVVRSGSAQSYGYEGHLYPWATGHIDVSDLEPGEYTFVAMTEDPSGGEGPGPTVDTRTVIIK